MIIYQPPKAAERISVIDFSGALSSDLEARKAVAWEIHRACRETGFFYLVNHGVPLDVMRRQLDLTRRFFSQPDEEKTALHIGRSPRRRGYEPLALQTLDAGAPPDLKESLMLGWEPPGASDDEANPWPLGIEGFRAGAEAYMDHMVGLGRGLASSLALSLDLPEDYFAEGLREPNCNVRMLRYPPQPPDAQFNQLGAGAHTDWGLITILMQDHVGGLEVQNVEGDWIRADPVPDAFIVNLGDMVPVVTSSLYRSNYHRVLNNVSGVYRHSIATFFNPHDHYEFECAPSCRPEGYVSKTQTFGDHIQRKIAETYGLTA
jgi:isopenicillin N synthase-like dioxygenase